MHYHLTISHRPGVNLSVLPLLIYAIGPVLQALHRVTEKLYGTLRVSIVSNPLETWHRPEFLGRRYVL